MSAAGPSGRVGGGARAQQLLTSACFALIVLVIAGRALLPDVRDSGAGSTNSAEPEGRRALLLTLDALGFAPESWARPPGALPRGRNVLWMATTPTWTEAAEESAEPEDGTEAPAEPDPDAAQDPTAQDPTAQDPTAHDPTAQDPNAEDPDVARAPDTEPDSARERERERKRRRTSEPDVALRTRHGLHAPENYLHFVEGGGTLIAPWNVNTRQFLADALAIDGIANLAVASHSDALVARGVRISTGAELDARWPVGAALPDELCDTLARPLWIATDSADPSGPDVLAATIALGDGRVVLLASDAFTRNAELGALNDGELAVRLLEEQGAIERVLFDEYALGDWEPESALGLAFSRGIAPTTWHLLALLALVVWMSAWVRAFPRDPEGLEQLSPLSRAQAQANVLERAGRHSVLAGFARRAALARLQRAAGATRATVETVTPVAIESELGRVAERLALQGELAAWKQLWLRQRVTTARELESLQLALDAVVAQALERVRERHASGVRG